MCPRTIARAHECRGISYFTTGVWIDFGRVPLAFRLASFQASIGEGLS